MFAKSVIRTLVFVGIMNVGTANAEDCVSGIDLQKTGFMKDVLSCLDKLQTENTNLSKKLDGMPPSTALQFPKDAVVAFDLSDGCPDGWRPFEDATGRFIVGTGQGKGLEERTHRALGGMERHHLAPAELPPQEITVPGASSSKVDRYDAGGKDYWVVSAGPTKIAIGGSGNPIPVMPPFIALRYCKKL